ncbi:MAG TPA: type VI secretion system baseplate subunit TssK [Verrucomicrobiae bacterium]
MNVHWHEGLFLQPHHLQTMQRATQMEIRALRSLLFPYCYGVVDAKLSYDDLANGRLRFERLHVIMPGGQEVRFPEEAQLPSLDIRTEASRGAGQMEVFLSVPLWVKNRANSFRSGEPPDPRVKLLYIPTEAREHADENSGENPQTIYLRKINARLMLKSEDMSDVETIPLVRIVRSVGEDAGKPRPDPEFVPPSVLLRSAPTLHDLVRELTAQINASREQTRIKVSTGGLGIEVKWEITTRLAALNRYCAAWTSVVEEGNVPPFAIYQELRSLLGELLALHPADKLFDCQSYNHSDPLPPFRELDRKIRDEIRVARAAEPLKISFDGTPGLLRAALEPQHFERPTGYYLGVKTRADRTKLALYLNDGNKFKLMPRSMEQVAIFGIELKEESYPPLELPGQSDLHYFRLMPTTNQRRWDQVKQDKGISLVWNNSEFDLSDAAFTLYMTLSSTSAA